MTHLTRLARWGGIAAILGGVLEVVVVFFVPTPGPPSLTGGDPLPYRMVILLGVAGSPFLAAGIVALYARVAVHPGSPRAATGLAVAGAVLAAVAALVSLAAALQALTLGQILVPPRGFFFGVLYPAELWSLPLATTLLGVAVLWSGALGRWGPFPLVLGALMLVGMPYAILGLLWVALGYVLWSGRGVVGLRRGVQKDAGAQK